MVPARPALAALVMGAAFGVAAGLFKGNETGLRAAFGNLSAPWLLVAFLPALRCSSLLRGAVAGLFSTWVALLGFYASLTVVLAGHLGGGGYAAELLVESRANRIYFLAGLVTGPLLGAVGAWVGRRDRRAAWLWAGALLAGEVGVVALASGHQLAPPPLYFRWGVDDWRPYLVECSLGLVVMLAAIPRRTARASQD
jgi:Family of unknown function (DUF6518)